MSEPDLPPEFPYPYRPLREPPRRTAPVVVPMVDLPATAPRDRLFERRTVLVSRRLDGPAVTDLCAQLMALDGRSPTPVELIVNSGGGPLAEVAAILDVFDLMRAPVNATCIGMAHGTAAAVLACASGERRAGRNARISLRIEPPPASSTTADDLQRRAEERAAQLDSLASLLARATAHPADELAGHLDAGAVLSASESQALGLIDRVVEK